MVGGILLWHFVGDRVSFGADSPLEPCFPGQTISVLHHIYWRRGSQCLVQLVLFSSPCG